MVTSGSLTQQDSQDMFQSTINHVNKYVHEGSQRSADLVNTTLASYQRSIFKSSQPIPKNTDNFH
jgi:hypothetical protein